MNDPVLNSGSLTWSESVMRPDSQSRIFKSLHPFILLYYYPQHFLSSQVLKGDSLSPVSENWPSFPLQSANINPVYVCVECSDLGNVLPSTVGDLLLAVSDLKVLHLHSPSVLSNGSFSPCWWTFMDHVCIHKGFVLYPILKISFASNNFLIFLLCFVDCV